VQNIRAKLSSSFRHHSYGGWHLWFVRFVDVRDCPAKQRWIVQGFHLVVTKIVVLWRNFGKALRKFTFFETFRNRAYCTAAVTGQAGCIKTVCDRGSLRSAGSNASLHGQLSSSDYNITSWHV